MLAPLFRWEEAQHWCEPLTSAVKWIGKPSENVFS